MCPAKANEAKMGQSCATRRIRRLRAGEPCKMCSIQCLFSNCLSTGQLGLRCKLQGQAKKPTAPLLGEGTIKNDEWPRRPFRQTDRHIASSNWWAVSSNGEALRGAVSSDGPVVTCALAIVIIAPSLGIASISKQYRTIRSASRHGLVVLDSGNAGSSKHDSSPKRVHTSSPPLLCLAIVRVTLQRRNIA